MNNKQVTYTNFVVSSEENVFWVAEIHPQLRS